MIVLGTCIVIGGYLFSEIFLRIAYTDKWATKSAVSIMRFYCLYTFFMALNGITEAYAYSKANSVILKKL